MSPTCFIIEWICPYTETVKMFKNIAYLSNIYYHYALQSLKVKMSYPWDFIANSVGTIVYGILNVLFLWVLLQKTTLVKGWSLPEMVFLYGVGELTFGIFAIFAFHAVTKLSEYYLVEGHMDRLMLRPIPTLMQFLMENLDLFDIVVLIKGTVFVWWAWSNLALPFDIINFSTLIFAVLLGGITYFGIFLGFCSISFWFPDRGGLLIPLFSINEVSRFPMTVYPLGIRLFFSYVIPFAFVAFYPTVWVLEKGPLSSGVIFLLLLISLGSATIGIKTFYKGLDHYESTGT